ncbi:MAG: aminopeptidase P family protein [Puniceicoccales bacterium]|nr:aminopeptidase P family protein [Puniceicoccales bacterium]
MTLDVEKRIQRTRKFLGDRGIDYLLVNSTDEFLVTLNDVRKNSRYFLTQFRGSTGDALLGNDCLWLFVDGRYHAQAEQEINKSLVSLCKLRIEDNFVEELVKKISPHSSIGVVASKVPLKFYEQLRCLLDNKDVRIVPLGTDPVAQFYTSDRHTLQSPIYRIDSTIATESADEKFKQFTSALPFGSAYLETNLENIAYFTNLRHFGIANSATFRAKLVISKARAYLFTNEKIPPIGTYFKVLPLSELKKFTQKKKITYSPCTINWADFIGLRGGAISYELDRIAMKKCIKTNGEITHYRSIFRRADMAMAAMEKRIHKSIGQSEKMLSDAVEREFCKCGARSLSFPTILAIGSNAAIVHHVNPSRNVYLKNGDFVLLDCGAYFDGGYATDTTRTFIVGEPNALQQKVYTTVLKMQINCYHYPVDQNTTGATLDGVAREIAEKSGLMDEGFHFNHSLGHGIGIGVHESPPFLSPRSDDLLIPNMTFTIEPGLYREDFGGVRLENSVLMAYENGKHNMQSLSRAKFQKSAIDFSLLTDKEKHMLKEWI